MERNVNFENNKVDDEMEKVCQEERGEIKRFRKKRNEEDKRLIT